MEGPSLHLLAQELQIFKGQKIKKIFGNAHFEKEPLVHEKIQDIFAFGKRLIIQLETHAIITHFLMYGSYRIDQVRQDMAPRLAIETSKHQLYLYNCATKCIAKSNVHELIPFEYDILSDSWDIDAIVKIIKKHPSATIDDILLDQNIFAGVGNIIKNEALFLSKISPLTKVRSLSTKKLHEIALNTRKFSQNFLEWRKHFQLKKNLLIYRKSFCPRCGSKVIRAKTGKNPRWSFYCPECQR